MGINRSTDMDISLGVPAVAYHGCTRLQSDAYWRQSRSGTASFNMERRRLAQLAPVGGNRITRKVKGTQCFLVAVLV